MLSVSGLALCLDGCKTKALPANTIAPSNGTNYSVYLEPLSRSLVIFFLQLLFPSKKEVVTSWFRKCPLFDFFFQRTKNILQQIWATSWWHIHVFLNKGISLYYQLLLSKDKITQIVERKEITQPTTGKSLTGAMLFTSLWDPRYPWKGCWL